jgi:hypothetical protein
MGNISAIDLADEALGNLDNNDIFCTGKVRLQMAQEKAKLNGQPVIKHRNGKGRDYHMFSRFLILRIYDFFYENSFVDRKIHTFYFWGISTSGKICYILLDMSYKVYTMNFYGN